MIPIFEYKNVKYPEWLKSGNAARFAIPYAKEMCHGFGYDIGPGKREWAFPGAIPIDLEIKLTNKELKRMYSYGLREPEDCPVELKHCHNVFEAMDLPVGQVDYIFSSHCLEHIREPWHEVIRYWWDHLKPGGVLFLYLPHFEMVYWRPWNNTKHVHVLDQLAIGKFIETLDYKTVINMGKDLNHSFFVFADKRI